jgi:hypothetical protein
MHEEQYKQCMSFPHAGVEGGWTALMAATLHGRTKVVQVLLQTGADRYIENKVGHTVSGA